MAGQTLTYYTKVITTENFCATHFPPWHHPPLLATPKMLPTRELVPWAETGFHVYILRNGKIIQKPLPCWWTECDSRRMKARSGFKYDPSWTHSAALYLGPTYSTPWLWVRCKGVEILWLAAELVKMSSSIQAVGMGRENIGIMIWDSPLASIRVEDMYTAFYSFASVRG